MDSSSAVITVEDVGGGNPAVKFVHQPGLPMVSSWLKTKKNPLNVWGIKAKVSVQNCNFVNPMKRDVRGKLSGYLHLLRVR